MVDFTRLRRATHNQWRFYLGARGHSPSPNLAQPPPQINTGQLDTVVLLLVDVIGSIVISLSRCCLPNDEGPGPPNIFPRTAPAHNAHLGPVAPISVNFNYQLAYFADHSDTTHVRHQPTAVA